MVIANKHRHYTRRYLERARKHTKQIAEYLSRVHKAMKDRGLEDWRLNLLEEIMQTNDQLDMKIERIRAGL